MTKNGFTYNIKPYFNATFLFAPMTFPLMNMFFSFIVYLICLLISNYFNLLFVWLIINILLYVFGGYLRLRYLIYKGYELADYVEENERKYYKKVMRIK